MKSISTQLLLIIGALVVAGITILSIDSIRINAKAAEATLIPGTYTVGEELNAGRYTVSSTSGTGNFFNDPAKSSGQMVNEILGPDASATASAVTATFKKGDQIQISGMVSAHFAPVTVRNKQNTTRLATGYWAVGKDIKKGNYTVTPAAGKSGNFFVQSKNSMRIGTNEILGSDADAGQVPKINVKLTKGDIVVVAGMPSVNLAKY